MAATGPDARPIAPEAQVPGAGRESPATDLAATPRTYVGAYALCVRDGRLLLAHLAPGGADAGRWTLPGGGLQWGEDPAAGALRELAEETGLAGAITGIAGVFSTVYARSPERAWGPVHHIGIIFTVEAQAGELRHEVDASTDRCAWIPVADLHALPLVPLASFAIRLIPGQR